MEKLNLEKFEDKKLDKIQMKNTKAGGECTGGGFTRETRTVGNQTCEIITTWESDYSYGSSDPIYLRGKTCYHNVVEEISC